MTIGTLGHSQLCLIVMRPLSNSSVGRFVLRPDTTKVDHAIPLRDNWALPYFSCQVAALTGFLTNNISSATEVILSRNRCFQIILHCSLAFTLTDELYFSVDVLLSHHECHHPHLPPGLGTQSLRALHPRPLSFPARLFRSRATTKGNVVLVG